MIPNEVSFLLEIDAPNMTNDELVELHAAVRRVMIKALRERDAFWAELVPVICSDHPDVDPTKVPWADLAGTWSDP